MKRRFWWRLTGLVVAVFCLELYSQAKFQNYITPGGPNYSTDYPAAAFGGTVGIIFMSGILPLLWFAIFRKFDYQLHAAPMIVWYVLAAILWGMAYYTDSFHLCLETNSMEECLSR